MPGEGLFDDSSSEDEEQVSQPTPSKGPPNKRVIREDAIDDDDDSSDDDDDVKEKSHTDDSKSEQPQKKDNPDDDKMDVDDDDDDDKKKSSSLDDDGDDDDKNKSAASASKPKPTMGGLFDDSDDDDDDNVFDDKGEVVGSSAPAGAVKKPKPSSSSERLEGGDDDEGSAGLGGNDGDNRYDDEGPQRNRRGHQPEAIRSQEVHKPPSKATALDVDRPGTGETMHMMKLPNLLAVQPACFDEDEYDMAEEEEQYKGYVHNMMRWRYKRDGQGELVRDGGGKLVRESNTKLVKWSDGSYTLHIGNEAFNIHSNDATTPDGFAGLNGYVYLSHKAVFTDNKDGEDGDDAAAQEEKTNLALDCVGPVASRFVPKPSSLQSEAHKSLMVAVRSRTIKKARIATMVTEEDPEQAKQARVRSKEDAEKQQARKRENYSRSSGGGGGGRRRGPGMNRSYLEGDDDEGYDTVNIRALKKGSRFNDEDAMNDFGDDSDDSDGVTFGTSRTRKRQRAPVDEDSDDDEGEMVFDDDDDEEEELNIHTKKKATPSKVWDDDE
eukprot:CAMPEP_0113464496 /NCGR_PEP_ID=MMETSP0014_2-20120614/13231_1 /TAXON_ID=2857 /ORGANISM="Nitzschia sp." /LENGTH=549 /DNA_ID=CAMNT_0000356579 /DNA_START=26 /DNA_END=1675 /DNA_ORIENTATION=- /assembly_acc=CAM_ASM_000159